MVPPLSPAPPVPLPTNIPTPATYWIYVLQGSDGTPYTTETTISEIAFRDYTANLGQFTSLSSVNALLNKSPVISSTPASTPPSIASTNAPSLATSSSTSNDVASARTTTSGLIASLPQSGTSAPQATSSAHPPSTSHGRSDGTVAAIVVGVAIGLALLTFLATFLCMRRRQGSNDKGERDIQTGGVGLHHKDLEPKAPLANENTNGSTFLDNFLPQSADDNTVHNVAKTTFDQIELHVENFYQNSSTSAIRPVGAELATFDSPYLLNPLAVILPKTNKRVLIIKHSLAHFVTSSISTTAGPTLSLLPEDFVLLPRTIQTIDPYEAKKPGFSRSMSQWRVLTAYLRPNPSDDVAYIAHRDQQIQSMVQHFSKAFAPWQNPKYKDEDRVQSLAAILKHAAGLGIWMFSQPSDLHFHWPMKGEIASDMVAITPALVKLTDERGQVLDEPQVIFKIAAQKL